jgi:uncharacterized protein (DUF2141 family)
VQKFLTSFLLLVMMAVPVSAQTTANNSFASSNLIVTVNGLRKQSGQVCLSLFSSDRGFPSNSGSALQAQCVRVGSTPLAITFQNLKAGSYAVAVIHDVNDDNTLNRNFLGIPTEGFGFSRNPKILTGPPKFTDSVVLVNGSSTNIQIQLQYFLGG